MEISLPTPIGVEGPPIQSVHLRYGVNVNFLDELAQLRFLEELQAKDHAGWQEMVGRTRTDSPVLNHIKPKKRTPRESVIYAVGISPSNSSSHPRYGQVTAQQRLRSPPKQGPGDRIISRILRLGFLAPDIAEAILAGRHPLELIVARLTGDICLPAAWDDRKARLGID